MISSFLQQHRETDPATVHAPGTPLVALLHAEDFFQHGLMEDKGLIFGIVEEDGMLLHRIVRYPEQWAGNAFHTPARASVQCSSLAALAEEGYRFYIPTGDIFSAASPADTLRRARAAEKEVRGLAGDFSDVGDDFLYTCLSGEPMAGYIRRCGDVGRHLSLQLLLSDVLTSFDFVRKRYAPEDGSQRTARINRMVQLLHELGEMYSVRVYDRAMCMGEGLVARFAALPQEDGAELAELQSAGNAKELLQKGLKAELRLCSMEEFASHGGDNKVQRQRFYWFGSERKRLRARNMALHRLTTRPAFSLFKCNSEHFCHLCCKGKGKCPQLRSFLLRPLAKTVVPNLSWLNPFKKIATIIKTLVLTVKIAALLYAFAKEERELRKS